MTVKELIAKLQRENPQSQVFVRIGFTDVFYPIDYLTYYLSEPKVFLITGSQEEGEIREIHAPGGRPPGIPPIQQ